MLSLVVLLLVDQRWERLEELKINAAQFHWFKHNQSGFPLQSLLIRGKAFQETRCIHQWCDEGKRSLTDQ